VASTTTLGISVLSTSDVSTTNLTSTNHGDYIALSPYTQAFFGEVCMTFCIPSSIQGSTIQLVRASSPSANDWTVVTEGTIVVAADGLSAELCVGGTRRRRATSTPFGVYTVAQGTGQDNSSSSSSTTVGLAVGLTLLFLLILIIVAVLVTRHRRSRRDLDDLRYSGGRIEMSDVGNRPYLETPRGKSSPTQTTRVVGLGLPTALGTTSSYEDHSVHAGDEMRSSRIGRSVTTDATGSAPQTDDFLDTATRLRHRKIAIERQMANTDRWSAAYEGLRREQDSLSMQIGNLFSLHAEQPTTVGGLYPNEAAMGRHMRGTGTSSSNYDDEVSFGPSPRGTLFTSDVAGPSVEPGYGAPGTRLFDTSNSLYDERYV
jgi:hypothetical protein